MAEKIWTPVPLVKTTAEYLGGKGVPTPKVDAEILLRHCLRMKNRIELYTQFERPLSADEVNRYRELVRRRAAREPVSRIIGRVEFMGLDFRVTPDVFSPRPETELLVEEAVRFIAPGKRKNRSDAIIDKMAKNMAALVEKNKELPGVEDVAELQITPGEFAPEADAEMAEPEAEHLPRKVLDLCAGSGCVAISIAAMCGKATVVAGELSDDALEVARGNAEALKVGNRVEFRRGDFLEVVCAGEFFDIITCNPPYLVEGDPEIWPEARDYDPTMALYDFGGDGLGFYRRLAAGASEVLAAGGMVLVEVGAGQAPEVRNLFAGAGLEEVRALEDFSGIERVVCARKTE